jgi:hypothetical protein
MRKINISREAAKTRKDLQNVLRFLCLAGTPSIKNRKTVLPEYPEKNIKTGISSKKPWRLFSPHVLVRKN